MGKTANRVSIVKTLPNPTGFGKKVMGVSILPPAPSVLVVETNDKSGEVHVYMTDFQIKFKENAYLRNVFNEDTLNKWEGHMASETTYKDFLRGVLDHNYRIWRFMKDELKEVQKRIKPLPKNFDLQPYIDQIKKEEKEWDEADHTVLDLWSKNPIFGPGNVFLHQNEHLKNNTFRAFKNRMAIAVGEKRQRESTKTVDKKVTFAKTEEERNKTLLAGGSLLGGTAPYLWKSPFYIRNSVEAAKQAFRIKTGRDLVSWGFGEAVGMSETEMPVLAGLAGWKEITGQPVMGAFLSSESLMAQSQFSTLHRTGGSGAPLSGKITKEELERRIREQTEEGKRRLQAGFYGPVYDPKLKPKTFMGDSEVPEETDEQELARLRKVEATSRAQTQLATASQMSAMRFLSGPGKYSPEFLEGLGKRPAMEQLVFYLSLRKRKYRERHRGYFTQELFTEFMRQPKIGSHLRYREKNFEIMSIDIKSDVGGHRKYVASCKGGKNGAEEISVPTEEIIPMKTGWYIRRSVGFWENFADISRSVPAKIVAEGAIAFAGAAFLKWFKNAVGYGKKDIIKTDTKRMHVNPPKGLTVEEVLKYPKDIRVDIPTGTITDDQYTYASWITTTTSSYAAVRASDIYETFVAQCIDVAEPYPLANTIDTSLPVGARSYSNFYTDARLTQDSVSENIKRIAISAGERVGSVFEGTKEAFSTAISWGTDIVKNLFMGVVIVVGLGIVYKVAT